MKILIVGALSWNPERIRSLHERGHRLWGLWSRSMAWDQGPYPATDDCIRPVSLPDAASTIREEGIDCVYSLFQVYEPRWWGPPAPGAEHDVWTILRALLAERDRGSFDVPIVRHWGFDVHVLDLDVVRGLDGHLFCNREKLTYWSAPVEDGGRGIEAFDGRAVVDFLDSDRPKSEFMNDRFSERLSVRTGEIHTVCVGRPLGIDYVAAAKHGIHVHVYGNNFNDVYKTITQDASASAARAAARYVHVHPTLQPTGEDWPAVQRIKSNWVPEFSQYDAGWSYIGAPQAWDELDDRAAIPNRVSTYVLAGLPVIADRQPGYYRYDEVRRRAINLDLVDADFERLRSQLETEVETREKSRNAVTARDGYSFEATIDALLSVLARARDGYFARSYEDRVRFRQGAPGRVVIFEDGRRFKAGGPARLLPRPIRRRLSSWKRRLAVRSVRRALNADASDVS